MIQLELIGGQHESWEGLCDIADIYPDGWAVVGGQLTFLHLVERGFGNPRPTTDLDAAIDVRGHHPDAVQRFVAAMRDVGFQSAGVTPNGHQHRWVRGEAQIDILIPSGLDPSRSDGNRREPGRVTTIESRGSSSPSAGPSVCRSPSTGAPPLSTLQISSVRSTASAPLF